MASPIRPVAFDYARQYAGKNALTPAGLERTGPGTVRFTSADDTVLLWLDGPARPTGTGFGGWTVDAKDADKGIVRFDGVDPEGWTVPVLIDGWIDDNDRGADWDALWAMAKMDGDKPAGTVRINGNVPNAISSRAWLIQSITPGDASSNLFDEDNRLLRDSATITLIEPNTADVVTRPVRKAQRKSGKAKKQRTVRARKGDTLISIAARELGDPGKWHAVADANPQIKGGDPTAVKAGDKIKLP